MKPKPRKPRPQSQFMRRFKTKYREFIWGQLWLRFAGQLCGSQEIEPWRQILNGIKNPLVNEISVQLRDELLHQLFYGKK